MRFDRIETFNAACLDLARLLTEAIAEHQRQIVQLETLARAAEKTAEGSAPDERRKFADAVTSSLPRASSSPLKTQMRPDRLEATGLGDQIANTEPRRAPSVAISDRALDMGLSVGPPAPTADDALGDLVERAMVELADVAATDLKNFGSPQPQQVSDVALPQKESGASEAHLGTDPSPPANNDRPGAGHETFPSSRKRSPR